MAISSQVGRGGWVKYAFLGRGGDSTARVRFVLGEDGRLEPAEIHIDESPRLSGARLRKLPLALMEAVANGPDRDKLVKALDEAAVVERATDRWLRTLGGGHRDVTVKLDPDAVKRLRGRMLRLSVPKDLRYPDTFYAKVAELYTTLAANGIRGPAQAIADANDLKVTKVHRWIKEARRRGILLTPGRRGKAG